jgi:catechol 2,3-dioxygenase-like lactoylglutathione lyase family enzyme
MGLEIYMIGTIVEDMPRAIEFYRRLGLDIPEGSETKGHVEVKMHDNKMTFFLTTKKINARWDPARTDAPPGGYRMILEFYLKTREAVDAKYNELVGYGYHGHAAPFDTPFNTYFAFVDDPDGNTILLSAFEETAGT